MVAQCFKHLTRCWELAAIKNLLIEKLNFEALCCKFYEKAAREKKKLLLCSHEIGIYIHTRIWLEKKTLKRSLWFIHEWISIFLLWQRIQKNVIHLIASRGESSCLRYKLIPTRGSIRKWNYVPAILPIVYVQYIVPNYAMQFSLRNLIQHHLIGSYPKLEFPFQFVTIVFDVLWN